ncbi:MAG: DUF4330 family protein [Clostridiales bacterium]|mgnify:CR=1 FL=1|nr:DUF4330 family protein [Clostridiales bacterium]
MKDGKLFGKLNIVDAIVILIIIAAAVFLGIRYIGGKDEGPAGHREITYTVTVPAAPVKVYEEIKAMIPGTMMANGSLLPATVDSIEAFPCELEYIEFKNSMNAEETYILSPSGEYVKLIITCSAKLSQSDIKNMLGTQEIRVGKAHIVKTVDFEITGQITSMRDK